MVMCCLKCIVAFIAANSIMAITFEVAELGRTIVAKQAIGLIESTLAIASIEVAEVDRAAVVKVIGIEPNDH